MTPEIRIPERTFERLQEIAKPFTDTPATVIDKLLDYYDTKILVDNAPEIGNAPPGNHVLRLAPDAPKNLTHTKIRRALVADQPARNWNELVRVVHKVCLLYANNADDLQSHSIANTLLGCHDHSGYKYVREIGMSIQRVDAATAWRQAFHLAKQFSISIHVTFEWPIGTGSSYSGQVGVLSWQSK